MRRSEINTILEDANAFIESFTFALPPFAHWPVDRLRGAEAETIRRARLGWDVTDYGKGDYDNFGLALFTLRNGDAADLARGRGMLYAEKLLISGVDQLAPMHTHILKAEDIINRGGGDLVIELHGSTPEGGPDPDAAVAVPCDGVMRRIAGGDKLRLKPGESVTLFPGVWHAFWAERARVLIGEVSTVNDDETDNVFIDPIPRFPQITEDAEPWRLLVCDYPKPA